MAGGVSHSGDLAYRDQTGYVYFAGRLGDWMRVDGENLGTAPIERVLMRYPEVIEVAVYPIPDPAVGDRVMATLVLGGASFDPVSFREFLSPRPIWDASSGRRSSGSRRRCPVPRRSRSSSECSPRKRWIAPDPVFSL